MAVHTAVLLLRYLAFLRTGRQRGFCFMACGLHAAPSQSVFSHILASILRIGDMEGLNTRESCREQKHDLLSQKLKTVPAEG
jgi:hypothetical protein